MPVEWIISDRPVPYLEAMSIMEARVNAIIKGTAPEAIWILEHPPLYTAGTSASINDLVDPNRFEVFQTRRGGQYTYHGPGQRIAYAMLDLNKRGRDVRAYVKNLENWIITTLATFNIKGEIRDDRVGVWVRRPDRPSLLSGETSEDKIAAIGVRIRKWVAFHGLSINVDPDLSHFDGIIPCGIADFGVTSLVDLGHPVSTVDLDLAMRRSFAETFGE